MMDTQILYHGSNVVVEHPLVSIGRRDLDFGPGFYLTPLLEQASKWAIRVKTIKRSDEAIVSVYEFSIPEDCRVKRFDAYDEEWLRFIVDSRSGKEPWAGYDIVEGGVADDRVINAVEAYISGYADVAHTLRQLVYFKPNYQICILSQEIADQYLHFKSFKRIDV